MTITHTIIDGKLHVYRRENSRFWQCSSFLAGRNHRSTTKTDSLERAKIVAEEWYFGLRLKERAGELRGGKSFQAAADQFLREYEALTMGERSPEYVKSHGERLRVHLLPYFGNKSVSDITPGLVQEYRVHRMTSRKRIKKDENGRQTEEVMRPARSTLHHEIVTLRQVLKTAQRHGWVKFIPDLSPPYKTSGKISHRAWFSPEEYKRLYEATRKRAQTPPKPRWKWQCEQMHDYVLFMVNTGLRPDEGSRLEFRDVEIVEDRATGETILEISVRGKRGVGYCKSMPGAVLPFERLRDRLRPKSLGRSQSRQEAGDAAAGWTKPGPMDRLFPTSHRELFNALLNEEGLKKDREGLPRTAYSLRHTYICLRLMEGADIYQIAKNCRTSVEMIEKFYAAHIKNMIDAAAVNVRRTAAPTVPKERPNGRTPRAGANAKRPRIPKK
jgi:integrase